MKTEKEVRDLHECAKSMLETATKFGILEMADIIVGASAVLAWVLGEKEGLDQGFLSSKEAFDALRRVFEAQSLRDDVAVPTAQDFAKEQSSASN